MRSSLKRCVSLVVGAVLVGFSIFGAKPALAGSNYYMTYDRANRSVAAISDCAGGGRITNSRPASVVNYRAHDNSYVAAYGGRQVYVMYVKDGCGRDMSYLCDPSNASYRCDGMTYTDCYQQVCRVADGRFVMYNGGYQPRYSNDCGCDMAGYDGYYDGRTTDYTYEYYDSYEYGDDRYGYDGYDGYRYDDGYYSDDYGYDDYGYYPSYDDGYGYEESYYEDGYYESETYYPDYGWYDDHYENWYASPYSYYN